MARNETALLLIDNNCKDLNINSITKIIRNNYDQVKYILINNDLISKDVFVNYLPIATSSNYLNLNELKWSNVGEYSDVILIVNETDISKPLIILALFYRIITGKSLNLIKNGYFSKYSQDNSIQGLFNYYPFFLIMYSTENCKRYQLPEIETIKFDDLKTYGETAMIEKLKSIEYLNNEANDDEWIIDEEKLNPIDYNHIYNYILNKGKHVDKLLTKPKFSNNGLIRKISSWCRIISEKFENLDEFKYYDSQYVYVKSLANKMQVSIPKGQDNKIYVYKTDALDYNFRSNVFRNVLVNSENNEQVFVLPFYKNEQATRQTVRFLIMSLYNVNNNSVMVDLILLYLFMKCSVINDNLIKTKYENIARLFLNRWDDWNKFLEENRASILLLKNHFKELKTFDDDNDELYALFDDFVSSDFKLNNSKFFQPFEIVYYENELVLSNQNQLECFPIDESNHKDQFNQIEINETNWPLNKNYKCLDSKLQLNSSVPFFICLKTYQEFQERINEIDWMKKISKYSNNKLVLKGGAILDLLVDRKPKDYDFMNVGMSNQEFLLFLTEFIKDIKPKLVQFNIEPVVLFRVTLENDDLIEFILNTEMTMNSLFSDSFLPDQICYLPNENKLFANEYTLWALNYGYCELELEKHPKAIRLSKKLNKLGFNFFYRNKLENNTIFLKERLERYIWSISQADQKLTTPSFKNTEETTKSKENDDGIKNVCKLEKKKLFVDEKILFANKDSFLKFIQNEVEKDYKFKDEKQNTDLKVINFNGAIILPELKEIPNFLSSGLDWSF